MKKTLTICLASMIIGAMAGWFANQKANTCSITGYSYEELAKCRLEMIKAQDDLLHEVYTHNEDYWYDVLMEGDTYATLDSIRGGDWEDFYLY